MAVDEAASMIDPKNKPKRNKFALACAILASMTSILLGYGEYHTTATLISLTPTLFLFLM